MIKSIQFKIIVVFFLIGIIVITGLGVTYIQSINHLEVNLENKEISLEATDIMSGLESKSYDTKGYKISDIINENATFIEADKGAYNTEEGTIEEYKMLKPDEINIPINNDKKRAGPVLAL